MKKHVYLDYAATTPVDKAVVEKMIPYFNEYYGNPSSIHWYGEQADAILMQCRELVAQQFNVAPDEVIFTGGGTESDNLAIRSLAYMRREKHGAIRILTTPVEHPGVTRTIDQLVRINGFEVEYLPVDQYGMVDPQDVLSALSSNISLVSVIHGNNEIGSINPVGEIGQLCKDHGIPFHTDAVQSAAHLDFTLGSLKTDFISIGAHKFYGPKGVGALISSKHYPIEAVISGGSQEYGKRAGTQNVPLIIGLAESIKVLRANLVQDEAQFEHHRNLITEFVLESIPDVKLTGHPTKRLGNHSSFVFKDIDGNQLVRALDTKGFACSSGSACKSGNPKPSAVLKAIGLSFPWTSGSLRVTTGRHTTDEEVGEFCSVLAKTIKSLR